MYISDIGAIEILDSRGNPTIEAEITLANGLRRHASVPSGASKGKYEAVELRDGDFSRYNGKGVLKAVGAVNEKIKEALVGVDIRDQKYIDSTMLDLDGTETKSNIGANATLAVSLAAARCAAAYSGVELYDYIGGMNADTLPLPMMNILNGGMHAHNNIDIQEFMIVPVGAVSFSQGLRFCTEIYSNLKGILKTKGGNTSVGDEGGVAPNLKNEQEAIELIIEAIRKSGYKEGDDIKIALDAASSEWKKGDLYIMPKSGRTFEGEEIVEFWEELVNQYPIISIEDPASDDDWELWQKLNSRLSKKIQIVGDDLFVTSQSRIKHGISKRAANAVLIKPNQVGTLSETLNAIKTAKNAGLGTVISHRSGETEDDFISDLAVGTNAGQIKTGAPARGERTAKYNRLLRIEKQLHQ